jgi:hypothetical protein
MDAKILDLLRRVVEVLDADGIRYGETASDIEPLDVLREAREILAAVRSEEAK